MLELPDWVKPLLKKLTCPYCKKKGKKVMFHKNGVQSLGIREVKNENTGESTLAFFFEHRCSACNQACMNILDSRPISMDDFIEDMMEVSGFMDGIEEEIEEIQERSEKPKEKPQVSKITVQELREYKNMIQKCESHEEFMLKLGMSQDDIKKYNQPDKD